MRTSVITQSNGSGIEPRTSSWDESIRVLLIDDQAIVGESVGRLLAQNPILAFAIVLIQAKLSSKQTDTGHCHSARSGYARNRWARLVRQFRATTEAAHIPIIVLSTKEDPTIKSQAFAAGPTTIS